MIKREFLEAIVDAENFRRGDKKNLPPKNLKKWKKL